MTCNYRISETAADSKSFYDLYLCISSKTRYIDRLNFFRQIGWELKRLESPRESPEIIAVLADWGQGKTSFFNIIEEALKARDIKIYKESFVNILKKEKGDLTFLSDYKVALIDEMESGVDFAVYRQYQDYIRDFWVSIKELANSKGENIIYLSTTPSAYSKVFGIGGQINSLFPETYYSFIQRIKTIQIMPPSKLEFLAMVDCLLDYNNKNKDVLQYLDLPYWVIGQERRKYARFFNDILCKSFDFKDPIDQLFKEISAATDLNDEGETLRSSVFEIESKMDKEEIKKFHKVLLSRIFTDKNLIIKELDGHIVKGFLVDFPSWVEVTKDYKIPHDVEDFLIFYSDSEEFDKSVNVFISSDINKVIYEGINVDLSDVYKKLKVKSKGEAYALDWGYYESLVNTNVGGLIIDFKSREIKEKALKFVNDNLLNIEKEVDAFIVFLKEIGLKFNQRYVTKNIRILECDLGNSVIANLIIYKPIGEENISEILKGYEGIIHGIVFLDKSNEDLSKYSIVQTEVELFTPIKRQLLYLLFANLNPDITRVRKDVLDIKLGELKRTANDILNKILQKIVIQQLPLTKGNKRPMQSLNWILFSPSIYPDKYQNVFMKVNEIVNEKFRIFGSKQFHLEDIETATVLKEDIISYLSENGIINSKGGEIIYYDDLAGQRIKEFSSTLVGYLKQKNLNVESLIAEYIYYLSEVKNVKPKLIQIAGKIFGKSSTVEFLLYSAVTTGEIINYVDDKDKLTKELIDYINKNIGEINSENLNEGYFITVKKRDSGIRSLKDMKDSINEYYNQLKLAIKNKDYKNQLRLSFLILTLYSLFKEFVNDTIEAQNEINKIKSYMMSKLNVIMKAKRLLGINEDIEEEKEVKDIMEYLDSNKLLNEIYDLLERVNKVKRNEELMNFIDSIKKISGNEDNDNLFLIAWEVYKASIDGTPLPFFDELKNTTIYRYSERLRDISSNIMRLQAEIESIEKINPEVNKLRQEINNQRKQINELIKTIKGELNEFS
ncbi:hypothetical protein [Acidianus sp. HS-5]|uniref:hypothetical protein n=1 Tax=Acidianus sp. HS-5 TaxID=2886040 RepID=UPI001F160DEE|nr:hypothetical protein [Acidianus sp. HS-5]BDC18392.1 hypothetical protein HS5_12820 [Acidianus sp. HS-5]